ncbi:MAG: class I SAM-dependent methyltransferase [Solirubrobacteraceae bacterium]
MIAAAVRRRLLRLRLRGDTVVCPCCGSRFARFAPAPNRADAICPGCGSQERHRLLRIWLDERQLPRGRVLHLAPEHALRGWLAGRPGIDYVTSDFPERGEAELSLDITATGLPDASFDTIIASHVLEHVANERAALAELARLARPGASVIVMLPVDLTREHTLEDPAIASPEQRQAAYLQHDHVRLYGRDVATRLASAGMSVTTDRYAAELTPEQRLRFGLLAADEIYVLSHGVP